MAEVEETIDTTTLLGVTEHGMCLRHPHIRIVGGDDEDDEEPEQTESKTRGSMISITSSASRRVWHTCPICRSENRALHAHPRAKSFANVVQQVKQLHKTPQFHEFLENWSSIGPDGDESQLNPSEEHEADINTYNAEEYETSEKYEYEYYETRTPDRGDEHKDDEKHISDVNGTRSQAAGSPHLSSNENRTVTQYSHASTSSSVPMDQDPPNRRVSTVSFALDQQHSRRNINTKLSETTPSLRSPTTELPTKKSSLRSTPYHCQRHLVSNNNDDTITVDKQELQSLLERIDQVKDWVVRQKDDENERLRREILILQDLLIERQAEIAKLKKTVERREQTISQEIRAIKQIAMLRQKKALEAAGLVTTTTASNPSGDLQPTANSLSSGSDNIRTPQRRGIVINNMKVEVTHGGNGVMPPTIMAQLQQLMRATATTEAAAFGSADSSNSAMGTGCRKPQIASNRQSQSVPRSRNHINIPYQAAVTQITKRGNTPITTVSNQTTSRPPLLAPTATPTKNAAQPTASEPMTTENMPGTAAVNSLISTTPTSGIVVEDRGSSYNEEKKGSSSSSASSSFIGKDGRSRRSDEPSAWRLVALEKDDVNFTPTAHEAQLTLQPLRQSVGERILFGDIIKSGMVPECSTSAASTDKHVNHDQEEEDHWFRQHHQAGSSKGTTEIVADGIVGQRPTAAPRFPPQPPLTLSTTPPMKTTVASPALVTIPQSPNILVREVKAPAHYQHDKSQQAGERLPFFNTEEDDKSTILSMFY